MRFLIFLLLIYLTWRLVKNVISPAKRKEMPPGPQPGEIDDIMIKDPFCEVYFPRRNGVHLRHQGKDLYFCSTDCRDKFLERQKNP
jgi:YHS domain-containing protein